MKTPLKILLIALLFLASADLFAADSDSTMKAPENAIIMSTIVKNAGITYTMVDLDNNEMVIVHFFLNNLTSELSLNKVYRTGIIIDLEKQTSINVNLNEKEDD